MRPVSMRAVRAFLWTFAPQFGEWTLEDGQSWTVRSTTKRVHWEKILRKGRGKCISADEDQAELWLWAPEWARQLAFECTLERIEQRRTLKGWKCGLERGHTCSRRGVADGRRVGPAWYGPRPRVAQAGEPTAGPIRDGRRRLHDAGEQRGRV